MGETRKSKRGRELKPFEKELYKDGQWVLVRIEAHEQSHQGVITSEKWAELLDNGFTLTSMIL